VARRRLGVAVLLQPPLATEVDGLRRAVGDGALARIPPHLTLVPPVNVRDEALGGALERLRSAAAAAVPFELTLGPVGSFLPANPVLLLEVGGDLTALRAVRDAAFTGPLTRPLSWPWVPHVTLADDLDRDRIAAASLALDHYAGTARVERVTMLEERRSEDGRRWVPLADAALGPRRVVGRGGLEVELTGGRLLDPEAGGVLAAAGASPGDAGAAAPSVVVTARSGGEAVGVAAAWVEADGAHGAVIVHPAWRRRGIGGHLLAALEADLDASGQAPATLRSHGPTGFFAARSARWAPAAYSKATDE
jgi:2'-5' RNA ligase